MCGSVRHVNQSSTGSISTTARNINTAQSARPWRSIPPASGPFKVQRITPADRVKRCIYVNSVDIKRNRRTPLLSSRTPPPAIAVPRDLAVRQVTGAGAEEAQVAAERAAGGERVRNMPGTQSKSSGSAQIFLYSRNRRSTAN